MDITKALTPTSEETLNAYVTSLETALDLDADHRLNGDGVYVGYKTLKEFYKGQQWAYVPEENGTMRTYNYCFVVVENMTAFLASEQPEVSHEPVDVTDPVDAAISEQLTKFLKRVHDDNSLVTQFQRGARIGSLYGDTFLIGPFWDAKEKKIVYGVAERPELIRPIWKDDNFTELVGFIQQYRLDLKTAQRVFRKQLADRGLTLQPNNTQTSGSVGDTQQTNQPMVEVKVYWDDQECITRINDQVVDYVAHNLGFVPGLYIPNTHLPGETKGTSDIENLLDAQQEYNIGSSTEKDILDHVSAPVLWGNNIDGITELKTGQGIIYNVPEESTLQAIQVSGNPSVVDNYTKNRRSDITALARLNDVVLSGAGNVAQLSGRAMAVLMQGINNTVSLRKPFWVKALKELNKNILILAEKHVPGAKDIIRGNYNTSVFISSAYMRSITDELNKLNAKVQSLQTTQKNMGISSPLDEQKLMKEEMKDPILNIELSRQPGMLQAQQQQAAAAQQQPQLSEGQNAPGDQVAATPGQQSPTSPEGAVAQAGQRATNTAQLEGEPL